MAVRSQIILFLLFAKSSVMCLYELQTKWKEKILRVIHPNKNHKIRSALLHLLPQSRSPRPTPFRRTGRGSSRVPWRAPSGKGSGISLTAGLGVEKGRAASFSLGTGSLGLHSQDPALLQGAGRNVGALFLGLPVPFPGLEPSTGAGRPSQAQQPVVFVCCMRAGGCPEVQFLRGNDFPVPLGLSPLPGVGSEASLARPATGPAHRQADCKRVVLSLDPNRSSSNFVQFCH